MSTSLATTPAAIAETWAAAWSSTDQSLLAELFTEDGTYADLAVFRSFTGRSSITDFKVGSDALIADIRIEVLNAFGGDSQIAVETLYSGHLRAAPTPFSVRGTTILRVRDGLIASNSDNYSLATVLAQSGLPADWTPASA